MLDIILAIHYIAYITFFLFITFLIIRTIKWLASYLVVFFSDKHIDTAIDEEGKDIFTRFIFLIPFMPELLKKLGILFQSEAFLKGFKAKHITTLVYIIVLITALLLGYADEKETLMRNPILGSTIYILLTAGMITAYFFLNTVGQLDPRYLHESKSLTFRGLLKPEIDKDMLFDISFRLLEELGKDLFSISKKKIHIKSLGENYYLKIHFRGDSFSSPYYLAYIDEGYRQKFSINHYLVFNGEVVPNKFLYHNYSKQLNSTFREVENYILDRFGHQSEE